MVIRLSYLQDKVQIDMKERYFKAYIQRLKVDGIQSSIDGNSEQIR